MGISSYDNAFYQRQISGSAHTSQIVAEIIADYLAPTSVVDLGCGMGAWLKAFQDHGAQRVLGYDGAYVAQDKLLIDRRHFRTADLSRPLAVDTRYDLAVSLEVAEHLPPESAPDFIASLVGASDVVLFSAAIPFQGGVAHVNEQWQSYWARLFAQHGYVAVDALRPRLWDIPEVPFWYAQNMLLYLAPRALRRLPKLRQVRTDLPLDLVHPRAYEALVDPGRISMRRAGRNLGQAVLRKLGAHAQ